MIRNIIESTTMLSSIFISLSAFALVIGGYVTEDSLLVRTKQGPVRGYRDQNGDIFEFFNIPYATAPSGTHKFKAPLPPPKWIEPFEAVDQGIICPQSPFGTMMYENITMQENCLIANVFVPDTEKKNLPVLVVIHGGAYLLGFGNMVQAKNLIRTKHMIVVTFNYRLGIHGFLCLGTDDAPGNAGMKDQVALLRWVRRNIASFGGNPNDVTISGYSAGSSSVDLLMLSKSARGLFTKVIPESGSHLAPFSVQTDPIQNAKNFAIQNNFLAVEDIYELENFYLSASYELLTGIIFADTKGITSVFSPCVERITTEETFLEDSPFDIIKTGKYKKVPTLYGFTNMEGLLFVDFFDVWKTEMNANFAQYVPADLEFESEEHKKDVAKMIKEFYFGDEPVGNTTMLATIDYFTDILFAYPVLKSIQLQVEGGHKWMYLYEYSFVDEEVPFVPFTNVRGANHCAQSEAVFDGRNSTHLDEEDLTEELKKMKSTMRELWSNFITMGVPVPEGSSLPEWPPVGENRSPHMSLGQTVELRGPLLEERARFWDAIYDQYYRNPAPPPTPSPRNNNKS